VEEAPKKEKKELTKARSSSCEKQHEINKNKRKAKKKLNIKKSSLAKHFSMKNKDEKLLDENSDPHVFRIKKFPDHNLESKISDIKIDNQHKHKSQKGSIQASSRSYFRLGKNVERDILVDNKHNISRITMPAIVKGVDQYIKSRSKQIRAAVKLSEVQPFGLNGVSMQKPLLDYSRVEPSDQNGFMNIQSYKANLPL
jgi:hypothetical protein